MLALVVAGALVSAPLFDTRELSGADKVLHASATCGVTLAGYGVASMAELPLALRIGAGVGAGMAAGLAKEALDLAGLGTPSVGDLVFDALGVGVGIGLSLAIDSGALE